MRTSDVENQDTFDSDAVAKQLRLMISSEKKPLVRKTISRSRKSSVLAAMLVHSLRSGLRSMAGLEAPEEFVFEQPKPKLKLVRAIKLAPPMPEPEGPQGPEPFGFQLKTKNAFERMAQPKQRKKVTAHMKAKPEIKKTKKKLTGKQRLLRLLARRLRK